MAINRVTAVPLTSIDSSTFTGSYQSINPTGLPAPCFLLRITNNSGTDITISYDGVTDAEYVQSGSISQVYSQPSAIPAGKVALFPIGQQVYVKAPASVGSVYLSGYYQPVGE